MEWTHIIVQLKKSKKTVKKIPNRPHPHAWPPGRARTSPPGLARPPPRTSPSPPAAASPCQCTAADLAKPARRRLTVPIRRPPRCALPSDRRRELITGAGRGSVLAAGETNAGQVAAILATSATSAAPSSLCPPARRWTWRRRGSGRKPSGGWIGSGWRRGSGKRTSGGWTHPLAQAKQFWTTASLAGSGEDDDDVDEWKHQGSIPSAKMENRTRPNWGADKIHAGTFTPSARWSDSSMARPPRAREWSRGQLRSRCGGGEVGACAGGGPWPGPFAASRIAPTAPSREWRGRGVEVGGQPSVARRSAPAAALIGGARAAAS